MNDASWLTAMVATDSRHHLWKTSFYQHVADVKKHRRQWPGNPKDRLKFCNYRNLCLRDHTKILKIHLLATWMPLSWCYWAMFFPANNPKGFCSHLWKLISRRPWHHQKTEKHIKVFFGRFYFHQKHWYLKYKNNLNLFLIIGPIRAAGSLDNGTKGQVACRPDLRPAKQQSYFLAGRTSG